GIVAANLALIATNVAAVERFVERRQGVVSWTAPQAGSVALARFDVPGGVEAMCERAATEAGIMLLPSVVFGFGDEHVRFGLGRETFADGLAEFDAWLTDYHS
ncbi:MAG: hypothetical protein Q7W30_10040, partial [Coriobacteriia bacterium]|nr:hypothetical protein [Coriobacteriia bacterium]